VLYIHSGCRCCIYIQGVGAVLTLIIHRLSKGVLLTAGGGRAGTAAGGGGSAAGNGYIFYLSKGFVLTSLQRLD